MENVFLVLNLFTEWVYWFISRKTIIFQSSRERGSNIFQRESNFSKGGGGAIAKQKNLRFAEGRSGPSAPPPSGSTHD